MNPCHINRIICADCRDAILKEFPHNSVDLIIADPPYYQIVKETWDNQWSTINEYLNWCKEWLIQCY